MNRLYINGVEVANRVRSGSLTNAVHGVMIGRENSGVPRYFSGQIDSPSVYNVALTAAQIEAMYKAGGVSKNGAGGNVVYGNVIGRNAANSAALANNGSGIAISSPNNIIGGTSAGQANTIANNGADGVFCDKRIRQYDRRQLDVPQWRSDIEPGNRLEQRWRHGQRWAVVGDAGEPVAGFAELHAEPLCMVQH